MKKKEQYFSSHQINLQNNKKISHSTTSISFIPINSERNQFSAFNDLTLSEKETFKSFVGPSHIYDQPDLTSPVNAPLPIGKWKRKKERSKILTQKKLKM